MSKRKCKKDVKNIVKYESSYLSQEQMIGIQSEAYYRALKRIENEKAKADAKIPEKKKYKLYEYILFILNVMFFPWKINKRFRLSDQIFDDVLVLLVSSVIGFIGIIVWWFGIVAVLYEAYQMLTIGVRIELIIVFFMGIASLLFGSIFVLAGKTFEKETDSNKIYAYSASIIALISCVVGVIALSKM